MKLINTFGLNPMLLGAQILNFLIVFYLLKKILYKPILDHLKNRKERIRSGLESAREGKELLERAKREEKDVLTNAQREAQEILREAKNKSREILAEAGLEAKKQSESIIKQAEEQMEQEALRTEKKLSAYITKASINILEKALSKMLNRKTQEEVLSQVLKEIS